MCWLTRVLFAAVCATLAGCGAVAIQQGQEAMPIYNNGLVLLKQGRHDAAIAEFDRAISIAPRFEAAYVSRGDAYAAKGDHDRAIAAYTTLLAMTKLPGSAHIRRARVYFAKADYACAWDDVDAALRLGADPKLNAEFDALIKQLQAASGREK